MGFARWKFKKNYCFDLLFTFSKVSPSVQFLRNTLGNTHIFLTERVCCANWNDMLSML